MTRLLTQNKQMPEEIFVGREAILNRIEKELADRRGPVILYGMGGMGKSSIAREYVRRKGKVTHPRYRYRDRLAVPSPAKGRTFIFAGKTR
ncbi:MAG: ATP-binding protein [Clostridiales bacterium]|nr:ATP-binding protein [Clostridiales bacterium]